MNPEKAIRILTTSSLKRALPKASEAWLEVLPEELPKWGIETPNEVCSFLAQVCHESDYFTRLEENLNYSAGRMAQVWPRFALNPGVVPAQRVPNDLAKLYERQPQALANYIYADANRTSKLGNINPGDGWLFRGRGPIQMTGRDNYIACGKGIGEDLIGYPDRLLTPFAGVRSACWYWQSRGLDALDDDADVRLESRRINGGEVGLAHRQALFNSLIALLG